MSGIGPAGFRAGCSGESSAQGPDMEKPGFFRRNGLSLVLAGLFLLLFAAQVWSGWYEYLGERREHGEAGVTLARYLTSGHFLEATAENWESEFLQMAAYVLLTIGLYQKGSSESKKLDAENEVDRDPARSRNKSQAPWPVRKGGVWLALYQHSLSITFALLFLASVGLHAVGGSRLHNEELLRHGQPPESLMDYVGSSTFWFESFQNWQSEFLALLAMVYLSVYLRQRGSPESKPVDAPHAETGSG
jgi:hypothetical protein